MKRSPWRYVWTSRGIREKLLMTLGILVIYRLIANIPVPGFNAEVLQAFRNNQSAAGNLHGSAKLLQRIVEPAERMLDLGQMP